MTYSTPSQKLRWAITVLYELKPRPETSEEFYEKYMEKIIDKIKVKIKEVELQ